MIENRCLNDLQMGEVGVITSLMAQGSIKRRLLDIGLVDDTEVQCILNEDCQNVLIRKDDVNYGLN